MSVQAISWVLEQSEATLGARLVLLSIANHAAPDGTGAWPAVSTIAREAKMSPRNVQRCLQSLQSLGELEIHAGQGEGGTHYFVIKPMVRPHCWYCGLDLFMGEVTVDHQIPLSRGGPDMLDNKVYACGGCNQSKKDRTVEEFRDDGTAFFGETDDGRQFVTRPKAYRGDKRARKGVTKTTPTPDRMSPEPSLTVHEPSKERALTPSTKGQRPFPSDWKPDERSAAVASNERYSSAEVEWLAQDFADYWLGNGKRKKDWDRTFHNYLRSDIAHRKIDQRRRSFGQGGSAAHQREQQTRDDRTAILETMFPDGMSASS